MGGRLTNVPHVVSQSPDKGCYDQPDYFRRRENIYYSGARTIADDTRKLLSARAQRKGAKPRSFLTFETPDVQMVHLLAVAEDC